jgi:hypothetical protein
VQDLSNYASIAQLGAGVSFAITIFYHPINVLNKELNEQVDGRIFLCEASARRASDRTKIDDELSELRGCRSRLGHEFQIAREDALKFLYLIMFGAVMDLLILILCTQFSEFKISKAVGWVIIALCLVPISVGAASVWTRAFLLKRKWQKALGFS